MGRRIAVGWFGLALALSLGVPSAVIAADWGGISPGMSTRENVRERHGAPSREARQKVEGYDTVQWIYEGARAPAGMKRMTVEFGLLVSGAYHPNVVRFFVLEPKPRVFGRQMVLAGWGTPDRLGEEKGRKIFMYNSGLEVFLDDSGEDTLSMIFLIPQPEPKPATK